MTELDPLFPAEMALTVAGERLTITAFKAKHLRVYLSASRRMQDKAAQLGMELARARDQYIQYESARLIDPSTSPPGLGAIPMHYAVSTGTSAEAIPIELLHERCYDEYCELTQAATGKTLDWVENLDIDELVVLTGIITQLNNQRYSKKPDALMETAPRQS